MKIVYEICSKILTNPVLRSLPLFGPVSIFIIYWKKLAIFVLLYMFYSSIWLKAVQFWSDHINSYSVPPSGRVSSGTLPAYRPTWHPAQSLVNPQRPRVRSISQSDLEPKD